MAESRPFPLAVYRAAARLGAPLLHLLFALRSRSGKEIDERKGERFGHAGRPRPSGRLVWIHAASVGETTSVLPLAEALCAAGNRVLLTTVTVTAAELARTRLPEGAIHQFVPYDTPASLARFLDHWSPDLAIVVESEIWPCLFEAIRERKVPFVLVNGRLSDRSKRNWSYVPGIASYIFRSLDRVLAQSEADAQRFRELGCRSVETPGNLKFDAVEPPVSEKDLEDLLRQVGRRPLWLAALTHPGEDEIVLETHVRLRQAFPDLLTILVPRHPARSDEVASLVRARGLALARRSLSEEAVPETHVYLGDTLGEMGLYYRVAPVTFLAGSFADVGGHNPLEAALLGSALATGPKVANARAVYKDFWMQDAALRVEMPEELADAVGALLTDREKAGRQAARARELVEAGRGALERTLQLLHPYLIGAGSGDPGAEKRPEAEQRNEKGA